MDYSENGRLKYCRTFEQNSTIWLRVHQMVMWQHGVFGIEWGIVCKHMTAAALGVDSGGNLWKFFIILIQAIDRFMGDVSGASV